MRIWRAAADYMAIADFNEIGRDLLFRIVPNADPEDDPNVLARLYPTPTGAREPEFDEEWKELVGTDLQALFESATDVVRRDLSPLTHEAIAAGEMLRIPMRHLDSWVNALNQARLAIAARYNFTEEDMNSSPSQDHPHAFPLFQMNFYGLLQERFIAELTQ